jgi:hypothetical protein
MCNKLLTEKEQMAKRIQEQEDKLKELKDRNHEDTKKESLATPSNERNVKNKIQTRGLNKKKIIDVDNNGSDSNTKSNSDKKLFVGMDNIGTGDRKRSLNSLENNNNAKNNNSGFTHLAEIKSKNKTICTPIKNDEVKSRPNIPKSASRVRTE